MYASGTDERKDGAIKAARLHHTTRMYTSNTKGGKDGSHKMPETTKTLEESGKPDPQQNSPYDMNGKQKKYTGQLIGGLLCLLAGAIAVS